MGLRGPPEPGWRRGPPPPGWRRAPPPPGWRRGPPPPGWRQRQPPPPGFRPLPYRQRGPPPRRHRGPPPRRPPPPSSSTGGNSSSTGNSSGAYSSSSSGDYSGGGGGGDTDKTLRYIGYAFLTALILLILAGFSVAVASLVTFGPGSKVEVIAATEPGIKALALNALIIAIVGSLLLIAIAALGIYAKCKMNNIALIVFIVIMLIFFFLLLSMGVYAILIGTGSTEDDEIILKIKVSMSRYGKPEYQAFWNNTQHEYQCCGIYGEDAVQDWFEALHAIKRIPRGCLQDIKKYPKDIEEKVWNASKPKPKIWETGCYEKFKGKMVQVGGICIGFTLLMLVCVSFACVLILLPD